FFQAEDGIRDGHVTGVQTCALPISGPANALYAEEDGGILLTPEIDLWIAACEWVIDIYRAEAPALVPKIRVCPCGVDPAAWAPRSEERRVGKEGGCRGGRGE